MTPRTTSIGRRGFIFLPPATPFSDVKFKEVSVRNDVFDSSFTRAVCPELGSFKITLNNNNEIYTDKYDYGDIVEFFTDRVDGTIRRFKGKIESIMSRFGGFGYTLEIGGIHLTGDLRYILVTRTYSGELTCDEIFKDLVDTYLTGYTYANVKASLVKPIINNWEDKPFWDCIYDLCKLARSDTTRAFDAYLDNDLDFHYFEKNTIQNNADAIVWNLTRIEAPAIGQQIVTEHDKIRVKGDDGTGLPVLSTSGTGTREQSIFDSKITNVTQANELATAERVLQTEREIEGDQRAFIMCTLSPGDNILYSDPTFKINRRVRIYKYTHKYPAETTICVLGKERRMPQIMKRRIEQELAQVTISNPFQMTDSWNFKFDDFSELGTWDSNIAISDGKIKLSSGSQGTFISNLFNISDGIQEVHLLAVSENLDATIELSTDAGTSYVPLIIGEKNVLSNAVSENARCLLRVEINSSTCLIDSIAVLYKS